VQSNGLQFRYVNDSNLELELRKLAALKYVHENNVISVFEFLLDSESCGKNEESLSDLINYFKDTWIGKPCRRVRRALIFFINVWNCYSLLKYDIQQTNDSVEGWHNYFSSMLSSLIL
jgi:hypothetical protein